MPHFPSLAEGLKDQGNDWVTMTREALGRPQGPRATVPESEGLAYWVEWTRRRIARKLDACIAITGPEGYGKSTLAMRLEEGLTGNWRPESLCYTAKEVLLFYQRMVPYKVSHSISVIDYDEGARGLMAGETFDADQKAIVKALMLIREKGAVLLICSPDIWRISKAVRSRRANLWIHITERGHALVHERDEKLHYKPTQSLGMTVSPTCPHLTWKPYPERSWQAKAYSEVKDRKLAEFLGETIEDLGGSASLQGSESPSKKAHLRSLKAAQMRRWRQRQKAKRA